MKDRKAGKRNRGSNLAYARRIQRWRERQQSRRGIYPLRGNYLVRR